MDILALLQPIKDCVGKTTLHQLNRIIAAMLAMTGRVTMLGISRWADDGGSYRTIQRFYTTAIPWAQVFWQLFRERLMLKVIPSLSFFVLSLVRVAQHRSYPLQEFGTP
jgi:putative transposase